MTAQEAQTRYDALDKKLGEDVGAAKERARLRQAGARTVTEQMTSAAKTTVKFSLTPKKRVIRRPG